MALKVVLPTGEPEVEPVWLVKLPRREAQIDCGWLLHLVLHLHGGEPELCSDWLLHTH